MSQNITLSKRDLIDIEKIKPMLLERKSQLDISRVLGKRRETINRKLNKWLKTDDFETWLKQAWIDKYSKVDDTEAFRALTSLLGRTIIKKVEKKEWFMGLEKIEIKWKKDDSSPTDSLQTSQGTE